MNGPLGKPLRLFSKSSNFRATIPSLDQKVKTGEQKLTVEKLQFQTFVSQDVVYV